MRFLLACSGKQTRWGNYGGVSKHLIKIDGEPLIERTVRLLKNKCRNTDQIYIVSFDTNGYTLPGTTLIVPSFDKQDYQKYPFVSVSTDWWNPDGETIILFGDVYFTENAINLLFDNIHKPGCKFYGRSEGSELTGCKWGEIFGVSFPPDEIPRLSRTVAHLKIKFDNGLIFRFITWEVYHSNSEFLFIEINDMTEDFDYPQDYINWFAKMKQLK